MCCFVHLLCVFWMPNSSMQRVFEAFLVFDFCFLSTSQEIGWEEHLRNDLFCVQWDVKPQLINQACVGFGSFRIGPGSFDHFQAGGHTRQPKLALVFMAALWNRAGHYIFALCFLFISFSFLFSSPNRSGKNLSPIPPPRVLVIWWTLAH